jgi:hypothetical protein
MQLTETIDIIEELNFQSKGSIKLIKSTKNIFKLVFKSSAIEFYCSECEKTDSAKCKCKQLQWNSSFCKNPCTISSENIEMIRELYSKMVKEMNYIINLNRVELDIWLRENTKDYDWELDELNIN